jgi:hypothetical protein
MTVLGNLFMKAFVFREIFYVKSFFENFLNLSLLFLIFQEPFFNVIVDINNQGNKRQRADSIKTVLHCP